MAAIDFPRSRVESEPARMPEIIPSYRVCGVRVDAHQIDSATAAILAARAAGAPLAVHLVNAGTLSLARHDESLTALLERADLNLPDGMPLVWIARKRLGLAYMVDRCYGPDLMLSVLDHGRAAGLKHYFYGSSPEVVEALGARLAERFPGVEIVGLESPPFRPLTDEESDALVARVRTAGADVVWVGLGTPKQDIFVDAYRDKLGAVLMAVGAAFDFHAGAKKQAPRWVQKIGMEWAFRLLAEPGRLWKRYLVGNTQFVWGVLRDKPVLVEHR